MLSVATLRKTWQCMESLTQNNIFCRFAQLRETGIWYKVYNDYMTSRDPEEQPSIIDVSMVTVAPILVVLAAGYVTGIFVLLIERCVRGNILNILKSRPRRRVRRWRQIDFGRLLYN
jgi:hypothetical protein